jgi:FeS assembly SUF system protein
MSESNQPNSVVSAPAEKTGPVSPSIESQVQEALKTVYDPEIPVSIYELGLIYDLKIEPAGEVKIQMTLTAPSCPEAMSLPARVESVVRDIPGVTAVNVELVWEPPWSMSKMSDAAKLKLGLL